MRLGVALCTSCFTVLFCNSPFRLTLTRQKKMQNDGIEGYIQYMYVSACTDALTRLTDYIVSHIYIYIC